jgi:hypothetical protein
LGTTTTPPPSGPCAGKADNADCNGDGRCLNGGCNPKPTCLATNAMCTTDDQCCTKACESGECDAGSDAQPNGAECQVDLDCRSRRCVGYRCVQGTAQAGSFCSFDARCASNRCSCAGPNNTECTCREATCGEIPAACDQDDPLGRDVDCCDGNCCQSACVPEDCFGKCAQPCSTVHSACCSRLTCRQVTTNTRLCLP